MQAAASALNLPPQLLSALKELDVLSQGVPDADGFWQRLAEQLERLEELAPELPPGVAVEDLVAWLAAGPGGHVLPEGGNRLPGPGEGSPLASLAALPGLGGPGIPPLREQLLAMGLHAVIDGSVDEAGSLLPASSTLNLPPRLLSALQELDVLSENMPAAEGIWQRLAEQLERLEELAPELPPGVAAEDLAAWLAAGPGGHVLPEGGNPLPGPGEGSPLASLAALTGEGGPGGPPPGALPELLREHLPPDITVEDLTAWLAAGNPLPALPELLREHLPPDITVEDLTAWLAAGNPLPALPGSGEGSPLAFLEGLPGLGGPGGVPLREQLLAMAVHAVMDGSGRVPGGVSPGLTEGTERGLLELAALQARSAKGLQLGQAPVVTSGTAEAALPQLQTTGGLVLPRLLSLDVPLQQPGWDRSLGDRVQWMVNQNVQLAELKLNPPGLGPLEVRVRVDGDRTHISFLASQANVRDAVDAALPRLREMFAEGGMSLGDVTVGHRDGGDGRGGQGTPGEDGAGATDGKPDDAQADLLRPDGMRAGQGLVDYYA